MGMTPKTLRLAVIWLGCSMAACNCGTRIDVLDSDGGVDPGDGGPVVNCIPGLQSLELSPADQSLTVGASPAPLTFTALGKLSSGSTSDVTAALAWSASREDGSPPGGFSSPGVYQPSPGVGGVVTLQATDGCVKAKTTVTFRLDVVFRDPGPTVTGRFNGTVVQGNAGKAPQLVYPSAQTRFPPNIYKVLFQWRKQGNDFFRITFEGARSKTVVYSDGAHVQCQVAAATAGCMETDTAIWQAIAGSNAGGSVTVTVDGVTQADPNVYRSSAIEIAFSRQDVRGAIFYWSTTAAGVRRASVSDRDPESYVVGKPVATVLPGAAGTVKCVACHTVSRSGKKLFAYTEAAMKGGFVYEVTLQPPPSPLVTTQITTARTMGTFRPDDARVVATVGSLLKEFDAATGAKISDLPVAAGTNPDWSPLGTELAYSDKGGDSPGGANLSVIGYASGAWQATRTLVPAAGQSNLFPSYSPDGRYVAYARGKGGHGDKTLQLWLVKADGSEPPVELGTANRVVNDQLTLGQHENNMPTWAPPGDLLWIAFNTVRPYGVVYPNGGTQQIWVAAVDPAKLGKREADGGMVDPSYPAFRFAFQGLAENNHRAFWTLDVRDPPDAGPSCSGLGSVCATASQCCAGLDCLANGELGKTCQSPSDAGACVPLGVACSQTSGAACCASGVCDGVPDGGSECRGIIN